VRAPAGVEFTPHRHRRQRPAGRNVGNVYVKLTDPRHRKQGQMDLMEQVRREVLAKMPKDLKADVSLVPIFSGGMAQAIVMYDLSGPS
jgi:hypothetical protein